ncbi:hypothetical protein QJS10_CPA02g00698 [Acorus calamus]|uniref:Uncharacterized protein n=1 Tax=Acorus calamus TaxID=4465 RepID=A0AAV9FD63_ACOCL|nr:hypothetical protein QJS10_CPA02g00698 [Acorus calamus]
MGNKKQQQQQQQLGWSKRRGEGEVNDTSDTSSASPSRFSRFRKRLHLHRHKHSDDDYNSGSDDFVGIALIQIIGDSDDDIKVLDLVDPSSSDTVVGNISLSYSIEDGIEDGQLTFSEFSELVDAFGNQVAAQKGTGNQVMTGGFLTDKQASYGWMFKMSEWAHVSSYDIGLRSGSSASHILDQVKISELKYPLEHFKTFNEFFIRELKPGARPIAHEKNDDIAICAADSCLMAFKSIDDSTRFWIKDYHRFHVPVSGVIDQFVDIPGSLYTVNPIAVNSKYCNVFTENKRVVSLISTSSFGKVAFVAIGATMVGSITFSRKKGDYLNKGDEDAIEIDEDLLANSQRSLETLVSVGMTLGVSKQKRIDVEMPNLEQCVLGA